MRRLITLMILPVLVAGCVHQPLIVAPTTTVADSCNGIVPSFSTDIKLILTAYCAKVGCHDGNEMPADFSLYRDLKYFLDDSAIYYSVVINRNMPQDTVLSNEQIKAIRCWLNAGYPEN